MTDKDNFTETIKLDFPSCTITKGTSDKYFITGVLFNGFLIEIMPTNSNKFVIRFRDFEFFDKLTIENYFIKNLIYSDTKFEINSLSIYVYTSKDKNYKHSYLVFLYIKNEIENLIKKILHVIND